MRENPSAVSFLARMNRLPEGCSDRCVMSLKALTIRSEWLLENCMGCEECVH